MLDLKEPSEFRNQILLFWRLTELCFYLCSHRLSPVVHTGTKRSHILYFQKTLALFRTFKILMLLLRKFPNLKSKLNEKKNLTCKPTSMYFTTSLVWTLDDSKILITQNNRVGSCLLCLVQNTPHSEASSSCSSIIHWESIAAPIWLVCQCCQEQGRDRGKKRWQIFHLRVGPRCHWTSDPGKLSAAPSTDIIVRHQQEQTEISVACWQELNAEI